MDQGGPGVGGGWARYGSLCLSGSYLPGSLTLALFLPLSWLYLRGSEEEERMKRRWQGGERCGWGSSFGGK